MLKIKQYELVLVTWQDAWANTEDETKSFVHTTTGFFYRETKKEIVLAQSNYPAGDDKISNNFFGIPKGCIVKIKKLKEI